MTTEPLPAGIDTDHLTEALRRSGALGDGRVAGIAVESSRDTILSRIVRLRLTYDGAAAGAPPSLILKTSRRDRTFTWKSSEVTFYAEVAPLMPSGLVPRCYDADWNEETKAWHLLLEDLTDTHAVVAAAWPLPPALEQCERIVGALARIHAAWWDDPRLGVSVGTWTDAEAMAGYMKMLGERFARFVDEFGDRLPQERRDLYQRLFDAAPRLSERYNTHRNMTIVHGDAHVWNCFLPRDGNSDGIRFFDWDSWRLDTGSDDLAYMMAMHWYPDRRRRFERRLLDRYHAVLVAAGVRGYDRRALDDDYRLSVLWSITTPIHQAAIKIPPVIWWNNLERIFLAVDDLGCRDLL